jgi:hypothetical protein
MQLALSYGAPSGVKVGEGLARVRLSGARERPGLRYRGAVKEPLALRELMGALHDVVISDLRWRPPRQREEFSRWLQYHLDQHAEAERAQLTSARRRFFEYLWAHDRALWYVLDPVCSVHPDQVFFEGFSRDGSSYARLGIDRAGLEEVGEVVCGTTNVDFSTGLYEAMRRLRSIWRTELALGEDALEVSTAGADLLRHLRLHKARVSPRALRWELRPGRPVELVLEPWEHRMVLHGSSHGADAERIVRVWGRRRLLLLERVLPVAERFTVTLLGRGLPYFVSARAAPYDFTLGLSGWTRNDWTSTARFDALIARRGAGAAVSDKPLAWLEQRWLGTPAEIAAGAGVSEAEVHASLVDATGRGLAVYDLLRGVYRYRPLLSQPLPEGVGLGQDPQAAQAREWVVRGAAVVTASRRVLGGGTEVRARVTEDAARVYEPAVVIGDQGAVSQAECGCFFAKQHGLKQGLCAHAHALLLVWD